MPSVQQGYELNGFVLPNFVRFGHQSLQRFAGTFALLVSLPGRITNTDRLTPFSRSSIRTSRHVGTTQIGKGFLVTRQSEYANASYGTECQLKD